MIESYYENTNQFFKNELDKLNPGKILFLGEGEGRNAVYAAQHSWKVDAVDFSTTAKEKALRLAEENDVYLNYDVVDLSNYVLKKNYYDAIVIIYLHLHPELRNFIHSQVYDSLRVSGKLILEVFEKEQLGKSSGGPQSIEMLYSINKLKADFVNMNIELLEKKLIILDEGDQHRGEAVVVRLIAVRSE